MEILSLVSSDKVMEFIGEKFFGFFEICAKAIGRLRDTGVRHQ